MKAEDYYKSVSLEEEKKIKSSLESGAWALESEYDDDGGYDVHTAELMFDEYGLFRRGIYDADGEYTGYFEIDGMFYTE
jgi:hypothetical protein